MDFHSQRQIHLDRIEMLVIDEADRMLDMGFIPQVRRIVRQTPPKSHRQTMFFSATFTEEVVRLSAEWTHNPVRVEIDAQSVASKDIDQIVYLVEADRKLDLLLNLLQQPEGRQRDDLRQPSRPGATPARAPGTRGCQLRHPVGRSAAAQAREDAGSLPRRAHTACWWPPTWQAAASTSRASRTW
jgi:superfamily II DNA/RNA helicase